MFVHSRDISNNFRISSAGNGQQKLKKLKEADEEGANKAPYFSLRNVVE